MTRNERKKDQVTSVKEENDMRSMEELLDNLAECFRQDLKDPRQIQLQFNRIMERCATEGIVLPKDEKGGKAAVENSQQLRQQLNRMVEQLNREKQIAPSSDETGDNKELKPR